jgi:FAD/FMN-containing dehydrogenase
MTRFNRTEYDAKTKYAIVGAGNAWDSVYKALEPLGRNVVGGRLPGIGVAGFTLGGGESRIRHTVLETCLLNLQIFTGYSWLTNQHGLGLDNVVQFEIALPNGTAANVTSEGNPDLFFALRVRLI